MSTPIYLHENTHATVGLEQEYIDSVEKFLYPSIERARDNFAIRPAGAFKVDVNGAEWPNFVFFWRYDSWQAWVDERKPIAGGENVAETSAEYIPDPALMEYVRGATKWRSRSVETVLVPLSFSPLPAEAPTRTAEGTVILEQRFTVRKGGVAEFLAAMENSVIKSACSEGLDLQLFARAAHRPLEYAVMWSLEFDHLAALWTARDPSSETSFLPGLDAAWDQVADLVETTLIPLAFSPLGGTR